MSRGEMSEFPRGELGHSNPHCIVRFFFELRVCTQRPPCIAEIAVNIAAVGNV